MSKKDRKPGGLEGALLDCREVWLKYQSTLRTALEREHANTSLTGDTPEERRENEKRFYEGTRRAYKEADAWQSQLEASYQNLTYYMPRQDLLADGHPEHIELAITFCETDIPTFRTGYWKANMFNTLKGQKLSKQHVARLKALGIYYVSTPGGRREIRELNRLLIPLADAKLIKEIESIFLTHELSFIRKRARSFLYIILNSRPDLQSEIATLLGDIKLKLYAPK